MDILPIDHTTRIKSLAEQVAQGSSSYVVDVEIKGGAGQPLIWVYIDAISGQASIEDCSRISKELILLMDANEVYANGNYTLNVSTPGLSRPLQDIRQYKNNIGRRAKIKTRYEGEKTEIHEGVLAELVEDRVRLETKKGNIDLDFKDIIETKILPAW